MEDESIVSLDNAVREVFGKDKVLSERLTRRAIGYNWTIDIQWNRSAKVNLRIGEFERLKLSGSTDSLKLVKEKRDYLQSWMHQTKSNTEGKDTLIQKGWEVFN